MTDALSDKEEIFAQRESALDGALSAYISVLTQRASGTIFFRTGAGRIFRDLLLHWPAVEDWEDEAQVLCQKITDAVYPLTEVLLAQAVEIAVTISSIPIQAPTQIDAMSTYVVFDTEEHLERQCFLSPEHPLPQLEMMTTQKGIAVLCRPLHYRYHTILDDRKWIAAPGVGMYELVERQVNALYDLPEAYPQKPLIDGIKAEVESMPKTMERFEESRRANLAQTSSHLSPVLPTLAAMTSLSALPPPVRALEQRLMAHVVDESLSPELRLGLRQIAQNIRALYPQTSIEEAAHRQTAPLVFQIPSPAPHPSTQEQQDTEAKQAPISVPLASLLAVPLALLPVAPTPPSISAVAPTAAAPANMPEQVFPSGQPMQKNRIEQEHQARSDVQNGRLPDPALYNLGDHYYQNAYNDFMTTKQKEVSSASQAVVMQVPSEVVHQTGVATPLESVLPTRTQASMPLTVPTREIHVATPPALQPVQPLTVSQPAQQQAMAAVQTQFSITKATTAQTPLQTASVSNPTTSPAATPQSTTSSPNQSPAEKMGEPTTEHVETSSADHRVTEDTSHPTTSPAATPQSTTSSPNQSPAEKTAEPTTEHVETSSADHRVTEDTSHPTTQHAEVPSVDHRVTENASRPTERHTETAPADQHATEHSSRSTAQRTETSSTAHGNQSEEDSNRTTRQPTMHSASRRHVAENEHAVRPASLAAQDRYERPISLQKMPASRQTDRFFTSSSHRTMDPGSRQQNVYDKLRVSAPSALHQAIPAVVVGKLNKAALLKNKKWQQSLFSKSPVSAMAISRAVMAKKESRVKTAMGSKFNKRVAPKTNSLKTRLWASFPTPSPIPAPYLPVPRTKI